MKTNQKRRNLNDDSCNLRLFESRECTTAWIVVHSRFERRNKVS